MNWAWALGMVILAIVPSIVGGGLVWSFFEKWAAVGIWEIVFLAILTLVIINGTKKGSNAH